MGCPSWQLSQEIFIKTEAAVQRCSSEKNVLKNAANLQENTHAEVRSQ